ncbi:hypothetical protein KY289_002621 [Solanum tuberosum]|nr:hypothetical protein KY289_002621 [Solanum tuberosum]
MTVLRSNNSTLNSDITWSLIYSLLPFSRGVILMRLEHAGKIQSASLISAADADSDSDPEVEDAAAVEA